MSRNNEVDDDDILGLPQRLRVRPPRFGRAALASGSGTAEVSFIRGRFGTSDSPPNRYMQLTGITIIN